MGPFVPDVITDELNLLVALIVGIAFGFILEQAGFSSSRKLTGLFYGIDFTVLRVFFTAGVTAMTGVVLLGKLGWLDTSLIYINPTFVWSALLGGAIMGIGFVVGGYCPGTSFCGAAVGRIDGMLFVGGGLIGALIFGEMFPRVQAFYTAGSKGDLTLATALGVSPGVVLLGFVVIAIVAFVITGRIERRVNPASPFLRFASWQHAAGAIVLVVVAATVASMPMREQRLEAKAADPGFRLTHPVGRMTADEVAFRLLDHDARLQVIDTRPASDFRAFSLPQAVNIPAKELFGKAWREQLSRRRDVKVFVADDQDAATEAASLALALGVENVFVLDGGLRGFRRDLLDIAAHDTAALDGDTRDFRLDAAPKIAALIKARGAAKPVERKVKKVAGGCGV